MVADLSRTTNAPIGLPPPFFFFFISSRHVVGYLTWLLLLGIVIYLQQRGYPAAAA